MVIEDVPGDTYSGKARSIGPVKAPFRLYQGSIKALLRLYQRSRRAKVRAEGS
jgi:hypothetical protein